MTVTQFMMSPSNASWQPIAVTTTPPMTTARDSGPAYCDITDRTASLFMPAVYGVVFCLGLPGNALAALCRTGRFHSQARKLLLPAWATPSSWLRPQYRASNELRSSTRTFSR